LFLAPQCSFLLGCGTECKPDENILAHNQTQATLELVCHASTGGGTVNGRIGRVAGLGINFFLFLFFLLLYEYFMLDLMKD
jgi:hypothetical protein